MKMRKRPRRNRLRFFSLNQARGDQGHDGSRAAHDLKASAGSVCALAATGAVALIVGLAAVVIPRPAGALPSYAQQTGLACGRCHVSPAGGGPRTAFGNAFAANGHKVPAKPSQPRPGPVAPRLVRCDCRSGDVQLQPLLAAAAIIHRSSIRASVICRNWAIRTASSSGSIRTATDTVVGRRLLSGLGPHCSQPRDVAECRRKSHVRDHTRRRVGACWVSCFWLLPRFSA